MVSIALSRPLWKEAKDKPTIMRRKALRTRRDHALAAAAVCVCVCMHTTFSGVKNFVCFEGFGLCRGASLK